MTNSTRFHKFFISRLYDQARRKIEQSVKSYASSYIEKLIIKYVQNQMYHAIYRVFFVLNAHSFWMRTSVADGLQTTNFPEIQSTRVVFSLLGLYY